MLSTIYIFILYIILHIRSHLGSSTQAPSIEVFLDGIEMITPTSTCRTSSQPNPALSPEKRPRNRPRTLGAMGRGRGRSRGHNAGRGRRGGCSGSGSNCRSSSSSSSSSTLAPSAALGQEEVGDDKAIAKSSSNGTPTASVALGQEEMDLDTANSTKLRKLVQALPVKKVVVSWRTKAGVKKWVRAEKIVALIKRQRAEHHVLHSPAYTDRVAAELSLDAVAFWVKLETSIDGSERQLAPDGKLTPICRLGLFTAMRAGLLVRLYTYHDRISNLPPHASPGSLTICNAAEILPFREFQAQMMATGWPEANMSDFFRIMAKCSSNSERGGWLIDLDTIWLRRPDMGTLKACSGPRPVTTTGHVFGTQQSKRRQRRDEEYWKVNYLITPGTRSYIIPPLYFPKGSSILPDMAALVQKQCQSFCQPGDYNFFLKKLTDLVLQSGFSGDFAPPHVFNPIPNWLGLQEFTKPSVTALGQIDAEAVLERCVSFNNAWQSNRLGKSQVELETRMCFEANSFFDKVIAQLRLPSSFLLEVAELPPRQFALRPCGRRVTGKTDRAVAASVSAVSGHGKTWAHLTALLKCYISDLCSPPSTVRALALVSRCTLVAMPNIAGELAWRKQVHRHMWSATRDRQLTVVGLCETWQKLALYSSAYKIMDGLVEWPHLTRADGNGNVALAVDGLLLTALPLTALAPHIVGPVQRAWLHTRPRQERNLVHTYMARWVNSLGSLG